MKEANLKKHSQQREGKRSHNLVILSDVNCTISSVQIFKDTRKQYQNHTKKHLHRSFFFVKCQFLKIVNV